MYDKYINFSGNYQIINGKVTPKDNSQNSSCEGTITSHQLINEPRREKTGLRGFQPGLTQTDMYSPRSGLEA